MPRSDLLILDFEQRKLQLKRLGQKLDAMRSKYQLLVSEQVTYSGDVKLAYQVITQSPTSDQLSAFRLHAGMLSLQPYRQLKLMVKYPKVSVDS